ncbi:hypothetical protein SAMN05444166_3831 [Singulisphaera sp. GP187]|uniref:hypothetical protein n=1 Tax=Singulisphaera sp. GP187 TaxID=1882752 RepID=UPI00092ABEE8|nr:hypothetical protein [Singulisphaera sp. GP187]SIO32976.1 hypothetical protein SAMN05444166_3831 [Singulisphaera sp. GP187]
MEGNIVTAAKWLGAAMVLASAILAGGLRSALSTVERKPPEKTPSIPTQAPEVAPPILETGPLPGDLEELAKSFHGPKPKAGPLPSAPAQLRPRSRSLFAEPTPGPPPSDTNP